MRGQNDFLDKLNLKKRSLYLIVIQVDSSIVCVCVYIYMRALERVHNTLTYVLVNKKKSKIEIIFTSFESERPK